MRTQKKNIFKSQRGDAIILLSVLVTGIVMLISVIAVEVLRKSAEIQNIQKQSIDSLYKAEEGIEYSLYVNKEKDVGRDSNSQYCVSVWDGDNGANTCDNDLSVSSKAIEDLKQPTQYKNIVVTSENNDNSNLKRTVFANLPKRYYDQTPLWNIASGCDAESCVVSAAEAEMETSRTYQTVFTNADYQKEGWTVDNIEYRLVFNCSGDQDCKIGNLKLGTTNCDYSKCPISGCASFMDIDFRNGQSEMAGKVILSDWFKYLDGDGNKVDLRGQQMVAQFDLVEGTVEEIRRSGTDIKMCKQDSGDSWNSITDRSGGLVSIEIRKKEDEDSRYRCVENEFICDKYYQICDQWNQVCVGYEKKCCTIDPCSRDGSCTKYCCGIETGCGGCTEFCDKLCDGDCNQWADGDVCVSSHNGTCEEGHPGKCLHWIKE